MLGNLVASTSNCLFECFSKCSILLANISKVLCFVTSGSLETPPAEKGFWTASSVPFALLLLLANGSGASLFWLILLFLFSETVASFFSEWDSLASLGVSFFAGVYSNYSSEYLSLLWVLLVWAGLAADLPLAFFGLLPGPLWDSSNFSSSYSSCKPS